MADAWKKAPVTLEVCWVMQHWKDKGWDVDYIIDQSLKWHISSFNGKSSAVPEQWRPAGGPLAEADGLPLRAAQVHLPARRAPDDHWLSRRWWENKGVAPCYRRFPVALRLSRPQGQGDRQAPTSASGCQAMPSTTVRSHCPPIFDPGRTNWR